MSLTAGGTRSWLGSGFLELERMTAGELRERVRFERRGEGADDGYGNVSQPWTLIAGPMAAGLDPKSGDEPFDQQRLQGDQVFEIRVRWSNATRAVITNDRAVNVRTGDVYDIKSITNPDQKRRYLLMTAIRGGSEA